jgi:NADH-ubiquinone oxidoreductase chain 4
MVISLFFAVSFVYRFSFPYFFVGVICVIYFCGCNVISYGLVLLSLWICVLMILARESLLRSSYFPGFSLFVVVFLVTMLCCTFRIIGLLLLHKPTTSKFYYKATLRQTRI